MLRNDFSVLSVDLRDLMGISPQVMSDLYSKLKTNFSEEGGGVSKRGKMKHIPGVEVRRIFESRGFKYVKKCKVMSFLMCKGGVGKTTSSFFVAQRLAAFGFKVLVVDTDTQGSLTSAFGLERYNLDVDPETPVLSDIVVEDCPPEEAIIPITKNLHLVPSTPLNANLDSKIRDRFKNYSLSYKKFIDSVRGKYNYIILDCAPALNLANTAAVCVSDTVILPVAPDKFSQIGLEQTIFEISQIERDFSAKVEKKILFTKYDAREFLSYKYLAEIVQKYDEERYKTAIRTSADLKNMVTKNEDLFCLRKSHAKIDYDSLCREITGLETFFSSKRKERKRKSAA